MDIIISCSHPVIPGGAKKREQWRQENKEVGGDTGYYVPFLRDPAGQRTKEKENGIHDQRHVDGRFIKASICEKERSKYSQQHGRKQRQEKSFYSGMPENKDQGGTPDFEKLEKYVTYAEIAGPLFLLILLATYISKVYRRWYALPEE